MLTYYAKYRALLSGKSIYYCITLNRYFFATSYKQAMAKFHGHIVNEPSIMDKIKFLIHKI